MNISKKSFIYKLVFKYDEEEYPLEDGCGFFAQFIWCLCKFVVKYLLIMAGVACLIYLLMFPFLYIYFNYEIPIGVAPLPFILSFIFWVSFIVYTGIHFLVHTDKDSIWQQDIHTLPIINKLCFKITFTD